MEIVHFPMTRTFSFWGRATWEVSLASHHCLGKVGSEQREVDIWFQCLKVPEWDRPTCQGQATYPVGVEPYPGVWGWFLTLRTHQCPLLDGTFFYIDLIRSSWVWEQVSLWSTWLQGSTLKGQSSYLLFPNSLGEPTIAHRLEHIIIKKSLNLTLVSFSLHEIFHAETTHFWGSSQL